jgi:hypothetical protein
MTERDSDNPADNITTDQLGAEIAKLKTASGYGPVPFTIVYGEFLEIRKIGGLTVRQIMVKIVAAHRDDYDNGKGEILFLWLRQLYHKFWPNSDLDRRIDAVLGVKRRETGQKVGAVLRCEKATVDSGSGDSNKGDRITLDRVETQPLRGQCPTIPNLDSQPPSIHKTSSRPPACLSELLRQGRKSPFPPPRSPLPTKPDRDRPTFVPPPANAEPAQDPGSPGKPVKPDAK